MMRTRLLSALVGLCFFLFPAVSAAPQQSPIVREPGPRCLDAETARQFQREILPQLVHLTKQLGINQRLQKGERVEDVLSFSYELAVISLNQPLGAWNQDIKERSVFYTYVLCPIESAGSLLPLPEKEEDHVRQMSDVRPQLVKGAYYRLMITLSIKRVAFQLTPEIVQAYKKLPPVEDTFDLKILEEMSPYKP